MSAVDAGRIRILIDVDGRAALAGLAAFTGGLNAFERSTTSTLGRVGKAFAGLSTTQRALGSFGIAAVVAGAGIAAVVKPAIEFESAFAGVRKTVDGSPRQLQAVSDGLLEMSKVMPVSAVQLAKIAENAGQLGVKIPDILKFTEVVAKLGATTDLSFDEASISLARFLNLTGSGAAGIERVGNVLVELGNNAAATESEILKISTRMASAFTIVGAGEDEILGLAAGFTSLGTLAEAGGSAANRIITQIADAAKDGGSDLRVFADAAGLLPEEFQRLASQDVVGAFIAFVSGLDRITESGQSTTATLEALGLGGIRTKLLLDQSSQGHEVLAANVARASEEYVRQTALSEEYNKRLETTESRLSVLGQRITATRIALGTPLLATFAAGADALGDALEKLTVVLGPLATALAGTFSNAADSAGIFFDVIGSPVLQTAVAGLAGLSAVLGGVLQAFNQLGPAGLVIAALAADIVLVGPASVAAASGLAAFGAATTTATGPLVAMRAAVAGLSATLAASPFLLAGAALVAVGKALYDAGQAADAAATAFADGFNKALADGQYVQAAVQLGEVNDRIRELEAVDGVGDGLADGWDSWGSAITSVAQILTPMENTILNARAEAEALNQTIKDNGWDIMADRIQFTANVLDLTESQVLQTADAMGIMNELTSESELSHIELADAMGAYIEKTASSLDVTEQFVAKVIAGETTLKDYADRLGLTEKELATLVSTVDGVELDDLVTDNGVKNLAAFERVAGELNGTFSDLAETLGLTNPQLAAQIAAVNDLAAAHSALQSAIAAVDDVQEQLRFQTELTTAATVALATAQEDFDGSDASIKALAEAHRDMAVAQAANAASQDAALAGADRLSEAFFEFGVAMGVPIEKLLEFSSIVNVPDFLLLDIQLTGQENAARVLEITKEISEADLQVLIELGLLDNASTEVQTALENARLLERDFNMVLKAIDDGAIEQIGAASELAEKFERARVVRLQAVDESEGPVTIAAGRLAAYEGRYVAETAAVDTSQPVVEEADERLNAFARQVQAALEAIDESRPTVEIAAGRLAAYEGRYAAELEAEDRATPVVEGAGASFLAFETVYRAIMEAEDLASPVVEAARGVLGLFRDEPANATVTADNSDALRSIREADTALSGLDGREARTSLEATDNASAVFDRVGGVASGWASGFYSAGYIGGGGGSGYRTTLEATDNATAVVDTARANMASWALGDYRAQLNATDNTTQKVLVLRAILRAFSSGRYDATITATDRATAVAFLARNNARLFAVTRYNAFLTATDSASAKAFFARNNAQSFAAGNYTAYLRAVDQASGVIQGAINRLYNFRSKTIYLTTVTRTTSSSSPSGFYADGAVLTPRAFGGIEGTKTARGPAPIPTRMDQARILPAVNPGWLVGEAETQGESWIPHAPSKRPKAVRIWEQTGRILGTMADGDIRRPTARPVSEFGSSQSRGGSVLSIAAPISVVVNAAPGMSEEQVGSIAAKKIHREFDHLARDMRNLIRT